MKITIVGGPSSGKTSLIKGEGRIKGLAKRLRLRGYKVGIVEDPARDYIQKWIRGKRSMMVADQYWILKEWIRREREAERRLFDFILCDGASFLSYNYCFLFKPDTELSEFQDEALARYYFFRDKILKMVIENLPSYDYIFFLPGEFPPKQDGVRLFVDRALQISLRIRAFLDVYLWPDHYLWKDRSCPEYRVIRGNLKQRVDESLRVIIKNKR